MMTEQNSRSASDQPNWYSYPAEEVCQRFHCRPEKGLAADEVAGRLEQYGLNKLPEPAPDTIVQIFFRQFKSPLIYLLLAAAIIVLLLGEYIDGGIIIFVLLFNAIIGTVQAYKAQNTLEALKKFAETVAIVRRDGEELEIPDTKIVPGDLIILQEGQKVPADARLMKSHNLSVDEAALTGESEPVRKSDSSIEEKDLALGDQKNMIFKGTNVVSGNAVAVVTATGLNTYIGYISQEIENIQTEIPLQRDVRHLSHAIIIVVLVLAAGIFGYGFLIAGQDLQEMFTLAVAVVVSAIPEALPIVMTLLLATGVWRMGQRQVLIKQLQAVEALGEAQVVAVDKTGTITKNELVVRHLMSHGRLYTVTGVGYELNGSIEDPDTGELIEPDSDQGLKEAGLIGALSSNAHITRQDEQNWSVSGDPTEAALTVLASKLQLPTKDKLLQDHQLIDELPFESKTKYHASLYQTPEGVKQLMVVGAPEIVLGRCSHHLTPKGENQLTDQDREVITKTFHNFSEQGLRVLAFAKQSPDSDTLNHDSVNDLIFTGLYAMRDALRAEVTEAVKQAHQAGVKVVMITGDHKITARSIAEKAGIYKAGDQVIEGKEIDQLTDEELSEQVEQTTVFARVSPEHKLRIVSAFQLRGEIIAMTGDGVNDAMSLVAADLGMSMGRQGTEVAKEASDLVIMDDNFASIIAAIEEGRNIYKGIKKVILFLFSTSLGEIIIIAGALLIGWPLPVLAAQVIWINFVTDGFLVTALAMDPKEKGLLKGRFDRPSRWIVDKFMLQRMILMSTTMALGSLWLFWLYEPTIEVNYSLAVTLAVTTMAAFQWINVWNCRSDRLSIFQQNPFTNRYLVGAFLLVILLHVTAIYTPLLQELLSFEPLGWREWGLVIVTALTVVLIDELWKLGRYLMELSRKSPGMKDQTPNN